MTILALDTTTEHGSIALRRGGALQAQVPVDSTDGFGHVIFGRIQDLLTECGLAVGDIDCFAAAAGPGSFTGVRVGLAAAKGFAEAAGKAVCAVSNLRALATFGTMPMRATVVDARRGAVYGAVYGAQLQTLASEIVAPFPRWLESLTQESYEFVTAAGSPFKSAAAGTRYASMRWTEAPACLASAVALCAELDFAAGACVDPIAADANYVRRADAELFWREN